MDVIKKPAVSQDDGYETEVPVSANVIYHHTIHFKFGIIQSRIKVEVAGQTGIDISDADDFALQRGRLLETRAELHPKTAPKLVGILTLDISKLRSVSLYVTSLLEATKPNPTSFWKVAE